MKQTPAAAAIGSAFGQQQAAQPASAPTQADTGAVDVEPIIAKAKAGLPAQLHDIFDKALLSGMRIMFDKGSHKLLLDELDKEGPLAKRLSDGIIQLMYILWKQSNQTLPPQIIVSLTLALTLRAFEFLQESKDPEATREVLGEAVADAVTGILQRFGVEPEQIPQLVKGMQDGVQSQQPRGMIAAAQQNKGK